MLSSESRDNVAGSAVASRSTVPGLALACLLVAAPLAAQQTPPPVQGDSASASLLLAHHRGAEAARYASTTRWVTGGFLGGLTLGPIGAGLAWTLANNSDAEMPIERWRLLMQEVDVSYADAYQASYAQALHARRKRAALRGGIIGTAALVVTAGTIWAVYYYY
jgi:hypothetical protein